MARAHHKLTRLGSFALQEAERLDSSGTSFRRDHWERSTESSTANSSAGHGLTAVLEGGAVLEKVLNATLLFPLLLRSERGTVHACNREC